MKDFLATQLQGARRYDRIAGFFSSSLLEVAGEALEQMTPGSGGTCARVVCNSCLNPLDVQTARAAKWGMHREWCASLPAEIGIPLKNRLQRIAVRLFGESDVEALTLPPFLKDAYSAAEEFCAILARRPGLNSGFMKTILLRRAGSTIEAGRLTAQQMLGTDTESSEEEWEDNAQEVLDSTSQLEALREGW